MSTLTAAQRDALPEADFGDPANRNYPIVDASDVSAAASLLGKAPLTKRAAIKARIIAIATRKGFALPQAWKTGAKMSTNFSLDEPVTFDADFVMRRGLIFRAGDYPDKSFSLSPEELRAAVATFEPVPIDLEHMSTPLDGKLGMLTSIEVGADESSLFGTVTLPAWLDALLEGTGRKVSATWDRVSKSLLGLALVNTPRITDAALMAAFAASSPHSTHEGSRVVQTVHDMTAKSGAVCTTENPNGTQSYASSYFHSAGEAKVIQDLHDKCTAGGAKCSAMNTKNMYATMAELAFSGSRHSKADLLDLQAIHDLAAKQGADCKAAMAGGTDPTRRASSLTHGNTAAAPGYARGKAHMSFTDLKDGFKRLYKLGKDGRDLIRQSGGEIPDEDTFNVVEDGARFAADEARKAELASMQGDRERALAEVVEAKKAAAQARAERMQVEGAAFADRMIVEQRIVPAEREPLIALLVSQALLDADLGLATFADGTQFSRLELAKAREQARPVLQLTGERLKTAGGAQFSIVPQEGSTSTPNPQDELKARKKKVLEQTTIGRSYLRQKKGDVS